MKYTPPISYSLRLYSKNMSFDLPVEGNIEVTTYHDPYVGRISASVSEKDLTKIAQTLIMSMSSAERKKFFESMDHPGVLKDFYDMKVTLSDTYYPQTTGSVSSATGYYDSQGYPIMTPEIGSYPKWDQP